MREDFEFYKNSIRMTEELLSTKFPAGTAPELFAEKRLENLNEIRKIISKNELFLEDFLVPLENKERLTFEDKKQLEEFAECLNTGIDASDDGILHRVYHILYNDAMKSENLNERVKYTYYNAYYRYAVYRLDPTYCRELYSEFEEIIEYKDLYDLLSIEGKGFFMRCWCNRLLIAGYSWQERREVLDFVLEKKRENPDDKLPYDIYILSMYRNIKNLINDIYSNDRNGIPNEAGAIELARESCEYIYNHMLSMKNSPRANRMTSLGAYYCSRFYSGEIGIDELIVELKKLCVVEDDYNIMEKSSVYLRNSLMVVMFAKLYDKESNDNDIYRLFAASMKNATEYIKSLKPGEINSSIALDYWSYLTSMTDYVQYDQVSPYYEDALKNLDTDVFAHSKYVTKLVLLLTEKLIENNPGYFVSMPEFETAEDVIARKNELINLAYNMSIFHDMGIYRLIHITRIAHRKLSEEEISVLRNHVLVNDKMAENRIPLDLQEGVECHHIDYSGNGYPDSPRLLKHKAIIDILYFANKLEKMTNPFRFMSDDVTGFDDFAENAKALAGSEYAPEVIKAFLEPDTNALIKDMLGEERTKFIADCYCVQ